MTNTLHILTSQQIPAEITAIDAKAPIVLTQDAVYLSLQLPTALQGKKVYALENDLIARGIAHSVDDLENAAIELISYLQLVNLVVKFDRNVTW